MDSGFWNDEFKRDPEQVMVVDRLLDGEIASLPPGSALDLGCGNGRNALDLAVRGWSVLGVDWAGHAIALAREAARAQGAGAEFVVRDITTWEPPRRFDLVISTYALPGGEESRLALTTATKALAQGGTLIVAEWDRSMAQVWDWGDEGDALMTPEQIASLLAGLVIKKCEVRRFNNMFDDPQDLRGSQGAAANVALVRATRP